MTKVVPLINDAWFFYKKHFSAICLILLPFIVPITIGLRTIEYIAGDAWYAQSILLLSIIAGAAIYPIYQGAIILYIASALTGKHLTTAEYYRLSLKFWPTLFSIYVITMVAAIGGLFLLILPGLIVLSRLSFSNFYCIFDEANSANALSLSWENTKDIQWLLLRGILLIGVAIAVPIWIFEYTMHSLELWNPVSSFISDLISVLLAPLLTMFLIRVFTLKRENPL